MKEWGAHDYRRSRGDRSLYPTSKCAPALHVASTKRKMKTFTSQPGLREPMLKWERSKLLKVTALVWNGYLELSNY